jgi:hypothetical protein
MAGNAYPIDLYQTLLWKVRNFPDDVYNFNPEDNLTTLMSVLLGEPGVGQLSAIQVSARLLQQFPYYSDLDLVIGQYLQSPRLVSELYNNTVDPFIDQLSIAQWRDVVSKDSNYRERLIATAAALLKGATLAGVQALAEATAQVKFQVMESWTSASGVLVASGYSRNLDGTEIVFIPMVPSGLTFDNNLRSATIDTLSKLQPAGTEFTVATGTLNPYSSVSISSISGNDVFFYLNRNVTANNVSLPASISNSTNPSLLYRYWARNGQSIEAPYFAFGQTQEQNIDVTNNINSVDVFYGSAKEVTTTNLLGIPTMSVTHTALGG